MDKPPLRWVGGKQRYASTVANYFTGMREGEAYYEPFLGGGSVFLAIAPRRGVLGDVNGDLIHFYRCLVESPEELWTQIEQYSLNMDQDAYYEARQEFNHGATGLRRASLFLILNRSGFNGIWRVNRKGEYNVPYGAREVRVPSLDEWLELSRRFAEARLIHGNYSVTLAAVQRGDYVYLDPPYYDSTGHELFARYTMNGFSRVDHEALAAEVARLTILGVRVVLTIRDDPLIRRLYEDYKIESADVWACVRAKGGHAASIDLIIRNFG